MRGEIKRLILEKLREKGPMSVRDLMEDLQLARPAIVGAIRTLFSEGEVRKITKDRKNGIIWAIRSDISKKSAEDE